MFGQRSPRTCFLRVAAILAALPAGALCATSLPAESQPVLERFQTHDSLAPGPESQADAQACLQNLTWKPARFEVIWEGRDRIRGRTIVRFPSPVPSGDATNDSVTLEWYRPFREPGGNRPLPAVLVVHESGDKMPVGRLFARAFQAEGLQAFLIHLPYYGLRRGSGDRPPAANRGSVIRQAVADVRRARDAIAVLPGIDSRHIGLQGTSLGGFVVATAAALDGGFQNVFIMLAGGNLYDLVMRGEQDTAKLRSELEQAGYTGEGLRDLLWEIEPLRIAHRLDPQHTWLYSAEQDRVVPLQNALTLARAAGLDDAHHVRVSADHYTAIVNLATIVRQVASQMHALAGTVEP